MLQVRLLSGEAVTSIPVQEICDVRGLKQLLSQRHGLPPRFRQRVLACGKDLEDSATLDSPMDLCLVLLSFTDADRSEVDELIDSAHWGNIAEVGGEKRSSRDTSFMD